MSSAVGQGVEGGEVGEEVGEEVEGGEVGEEVE